MRLFLDTEFVERPKDFSLISIAIVSEFNHEFYAISGEFDLPAAFSNDWIRTRVLSKLDPPFRWKTLGAIQSELSSFLKDCLSASSNQIWAWKGKRDWLFLKALTDGTSISGMPDHYLDVHEAHVQLGSPWFPPFCDSLKHHALFDAYWARHVWRYLCTDMKGASDEKNTKRNSA